jgi:hypothetical protein
MSVSPEAMRSAVTAGVPRPTTQRARSQFELTVVLAFVLATACFVGVGVFADSRLERVAKLTRLPTRAAR